MSEVQVYQSNDDEPSADEVREAVAASVEYKLSVVRGEEGTELAPATIAFPGVMTGAEVAAKNKSRTRLHPEAHQVGMKVLHDIHGLGTIVGMTGNGAKRTATIDFEIGGEKSFRLAFVSLQVVDESF